MSTCTWVSNTIKLGKYHDLKVMDKTAASRTNKGKTLQHLLCILMINNSVRIRAEYFIIVVKQLIVNKIVSKSNYNNCKL